jgi:integral membrane protein
MSSPDPEAPADRPEAADPAPADSAHTATANPATASTATAESLRRPLLGYRVLAWATGVWLIALCYEMVMKYGFNDDSLSWIAVVHGWVYFVYLLFAANLAVKVRWPIGKTIGVLLAGTIPLLGIIVEHFQTKQIKAQFGL